MRTSPRTRPVRWSFAGHDPGERSSGRPQRPSHAHGQGGLAVSEGERRNGCSTHSRRARRVEPHHRRAQGPARDVHRRIVKALHQDADVDARHITGRDSDETATLHGHGWNRPATGLRRTRGRECAWHRARGQPDRRCSPSTIRRWTTGTTSADGQEEPAAMTRGTINSPRLSPSLISRDVQDVVQSLAHPIGRG